MFGGRPVVRRGGRRSVFYENGLARVQPGNQSVSLRVSQLMNKGQAESQSTSQPTSSLTLTLTLADRSVGQTNQISR